MMEKNNENLQAPMEVHGDVVAPLIIMIDKSASLSGYESAIEDGIRKMKEVIMNDDIGRNRVEVSLILFGAGAEIVHPFSHIARLEVPKVVCDGSRTDTHAAVDLALKTFDARKAEYKQLLMSYYRPIFWLLTDGYANDRDNGSFKELLERQKAGKAFFYSFAIGDDQNIAELGAMNKNGICLSCSADSIGNALEFIASSSMEFSTDNLGYQLQIEAPDRNSGITVKQIEANYTVVLEV